MISLRIATYATFLAVATASALLIPDTAVSQSAPSAISRDEVKR